MSTSLELSESSIKTTCVTSLAGTALLSELSLEDAPSPRSECVDCGCTTLLDVFTPVDCPDLSEKEVVGVSVSLDRSRGA